MAEVKIKTSPTIHHSTLGDGWYLHDAEKLKLQIQHAYEIAKERFGPLEMNLPRPRVLVVPHAGITYSGPCAAAGFAPLKRWYEATRSVVGTQDTKIDDIHRVIILAPNHTSSRPVKGMTLSSSTLFETVLGTVGVDASLVRRLVARNPKLFVINDEAHQYEHALEMELIFLQEALNNQGNGKNNTPTWQILPIIVGSFDGDAELKQASYILAELAIGPYTLMVISTDLTHYGTKFGFEPFKNQGHVMSHIEQLDSKAIEFVTAKDGSAREFAKWLTETGETVCGKWPLQVLLNCLNLKTEYAWPSLDEARLLAYDTSTGNNEPVVDKGFSNVSYTSLVWTDRSVQDTKFDFVARQDDRWTSYEKKTLLASARKAIASKLPDYDTFTSNPLFYTPLEAIASPTLSQDLGVFVTLTRDGLDKVLRGCIGRILPRRDPLFQSIISVARDAAFEDPRFRPVESMQELAKLAIEITLLSVPRVIPTNRFRELIQIGRHGVFLKNYSIINGVKVEKNSAVYLPNVPVEQGRNWTVIEFVNYLCQKSGMIPVVRGDGDIKTQVLYDLRNVELSIFEGYSFDDLQFQVETTETGHLKHTIHAMRNVKHNSRQDPIAAHSKGAWPFYGSRINVEAASTTGLDPSGKTIPTDKTRVVNDHVLSPSYGTVASVNIIKGTITTYMNIFDNHELFAPMSGIISHIMRFQGKFSRPELTFLADNKKDGRVIVGIQDAENKIEFWAEVGIRSYICDRIRLWDPNNVKEPLMLDLPVQAGQHIGKIILGSLTELHLPPSTWKIQVKPGDKMKGGRSIVAYRRA